MAKIIKITPDCIDDIRKEFEESLKNAKLSDGRISFSRSFNTIDRKATVYFTHQAWSKMQALLKNFDKEVAWHGVAYRGDGEEDEYYITDILVYPQEVTGSTVNTDQEKYQTWLMSHDDDVFNNIRMQGHSHVYMGTTPSGVDTSLYERILDQLEDDMFYIFLIYNKRNEKTYKIYDLGKNILFETADITVEVLDDLSVTDENPMKNITQEEAEAMMKFLRELREAKQNAEFIKDAKSMVQDKVYKSGSYYGSGSQYQGKGTYGGSQSASKPGQTTASAQQPANASGKKDKKKKKKAENKGTQLSLYRSRNFEDFDEDDDDNPYGAFGSSDRFYH